MRQALSFAVLITALAAPALAKLPPPSDDAKAKAAEAALKTAWSDKVAGFQLCRAMDKVAAAYQVAAKHAGKEPAAPVATPPCADPGPFAAPTPPLQAVAAHAPTATAAAAPGAKAAAAGLKSGATKK
jgi:hypothetical protein